MAQNLNLFPQNPSLSDVLSFFSKQIELDMNCIHIGTVQAFHPATQTADVTINYPKTFQTTSAIGATTTTTTNYPQLSGCPVVVLGGGAGAITLPIASGDECLIFFNDRDMSTWWGTGSTSTAPNTPRLHGFPDALVLVGVNSLPNVWLNYDDSAVTIRYGDVSPNTIKLNGTSAVVTVGANSITLNEIEAVINAGVGNITVGPALVSVGNNISTLGALLQTLITDLEALITALTVNAATFIAVTGAPGAASPLNPAIVAALAVVNTSLVTLSTEISTVLE